MKITKLTIRLKDWFPRETEITVRECKTGYPYLPDYRAMKEALSAGGFIMCKMEEGEDDRRIRIKGL